MTTTSVWNIGSYFQWKHIILLFFCPSLLLRWNHHVWIEGKERIPSSEWSFQLGEQVFSRFLLWVGVISFSLVGERNFSLMLFWTNNCDYYLEDSRFSGPYRAISWKGKENITWHGKRGSKSGLQRSRLDELLLLGRGHVYNSTFVLESKLVPFFTLLL